MKLALFDTPSTFVLLPDDLLWTDEFQWSAVASRSERSLTGALILESALKQKGRPISLSPPDNEMAWVSRAVAKTLLAWANTPGLKLKLTLQYPDDTREFVVSFAPTTDGNVLTAEPVKGFPGFNDGDWYRVSLKLMEIE